MSLGLSADKNGSYLSNIIFKANNNFSCQKYFFYFFISKTVQDIKQIPTDLSSGNLSYAL